MLAIKGVERARCESGARGVGRSEMKVGVMIDRDVYHNRRNRENAANSPVNIVHTIRLDIMLSQNLLFARINIAQTYVYDL